MLALYFPNEGDSIANGTALAQFLHEGKAPRVVAGSRICFLGKTADAHGPNIHPAVPSKTGTYFGLLEVLTNVVVQVNITTGDDVRPQAVGWGAAVLGSVESVNTQSQIVTISVEPSNWIVTETW